MNGISIHCRPRDRSVTRHAPDLAAALDGVGCPRADAVLIQGINPARLRIKKPSIRDGHHGFLVTPKDTGIMLILSIAVFVATLATPVVVLALWQHFEVRELGRQVRAIQW
jgi:hypothetical protein